MHYPIILVVLCVDPNSTAPFVFMPIKPGDYLAQVEPEVLPLASAPIPPASGDRCCRSVPDAKFNENDHVEEAEDDDGEENDDDDEKKALVSAEADRIKRCKGRVFALRDEPEVHRVWLPNNDARSFGDFCLKDFGLNSVPEVTYTHYRKRRVCYPLNEWSDKFHRCQPL